MLWWTGCACFGLVRIQVGGGSSSALAGGVLAALVDSQTALIDSQIRCLQSQLADRTPWLAARRPRS